MPFCKISCDLKLAVIRLYEREILPLGDILDIMHLSRRTFFRILKLWRETGNVVTHKYGNLAGRPRILNFDYIHYVLQLVRLRPDWFLDELLDLLKTNRFISIHYVTIHQELQRAGVLYKKLKHIASECNEEARNDYIARISQYEPEEVGFLDETSKNNKTATRANGHTKKGRRAIMKQHFVCRTHLSATALLTVDGIVASTVVEGSMNREMYLEFLEYHVVSAIKHVPFTQSYFDSASHVQMPLTSAYPGPLSMLIISQMYALQFLIDRLPLVLGVRIEYLPPYSPDLNPIEEAFSKIKVFIC